MEPAGKTFSRQGPSAGFQPGWETGWITGIHLSPNKMITRVNRKDFPSGIPRLCRFDIKRNPSLVDKRTGIRSDQSLEGNDIAPRTSSGREGISVFSGRRHNRCILTEKPTR